MAKFILLLVCLSGFDYTVNGFVLKRESPHVRIIGGHNTTIEKHPYQVSMEYRGRQLCGGAIIGQNIVLTAAHCLIGKQIEDMAILVGSTKFGSGKRYKVARYQQHNKYVIPTVDYDVGVIFLKENLTYSERVAPIHVVGQLTQIRPNTLVSITGWGTLEPSEADPPVDLQEVLVPIVDFAVCTENYAKINKTVTQRMFCAGLLSAGGKDSCSGDSGGPAVQNGQLIGIISWGFKCGVKDYPGIYTNIAVVRDWIRKVTNL